MKQRKVANDKRRGKRLPLHHRRESNVPGRNNVCFSMKQMLIYLTIGSALLVIVYINRTNKMFTGIYDSYITDETIIPTQTENDDTSATKGTDQKETENNRDIPNDKTVIDEKVEINKTNPIEQKSEQEETIATKTDKQNDESKQDDKIVNDEKAENNEIHSPDQKDNQEKEIATNIDKQDDVSKPHISAEDVKTKMQTDLASLPAAPWPQLDHRIAKAIAAGEVLGLGNITDFKFNNTIGKKHLIMSSL